MQDQNFDGNPYVFEPEGVWPNYGRRVNVSVGDADKIVDDFVGHEATTIGVGLVDPMASSVTQETVRLDFSGISGPVARVGNGDYPIAAQTTQGSPSFTWDRVRKSDLDAGITVRISKAGSANAPEHFKPQSIVLTTGAPNAYFGFFSKIEGTVTVGGSAAGGVEVKATPTGSTPGSAVTTYSDASGAYTLDVAHHGTYDVTGADAGYGFSTVTATVARGRTSSGNDFGGMANPVYGTIIAEVRMPDRTAFSGLTTVMAMHTGTGATYTLTESTSTPGEYSSQPVLVAGNYEVTASAPGYAFAPQTGTVVAGPTPTTVTLTAAENAMVSGKVEIMSGATTTGVAGVMFTADYMSDGDASNDPPAATSNADGEYEFAGLPFGTYTVTAMADGYTITPITSITPIPPGHVVTVDGTNPDDTGNNFMAAEVPGTISGTVYIPTGAIQVSGVNHRGLPGVTITADDGDASTPNPTATSGADGTYTISGLAHGTYELTATLTGTTPPSVGAAAFSLAFVDPDLQVTVGPRSVMVAGQDFTQNNSWAATNVKVTRIEGGPDAAGPNASADSVIVTWTRSTAGPVAANAANRERVRLTAASSLLGGSDATVVLVSTTDFVASAPTTMEDRVVVSNATLSGSNLTVNDLRNGFTVAVESRLWASTVNAHWVPSAVAVNPAVDPTPEIVDAQWVTSGGDMTITWNHGQVTADNGYHSFRVQYKMPTETTWYSLNQNDYDPSGIPGGTATSATVEFGTVTRPSTAPALILTGGLDIRVIARRATDVDTGVTGSSRWWPSAERRVPPR